MLSTTQLRQAAARSGARDIGFIEIDVMLTHLLQLFHERGLTDHLAFKGGTFLRKMIFGTLARGGDFPPIWISPAGPTYRSMT